ncbi:MAG: M56 family metallopeptidase [Gemmatimonadota bacterium]|nr:M56 family metallopeptidase [Gemmatimonadota bacterium]
MIEVLEGIGAASLAPFWVPVAVWTGLAVAVALALKVARGLHPAGGYRVRQGILFALPVSFLAAPWVPALSLRGSSLPASSSAARDLPMPTVSATLPSDTPIPGANGAPVPDGTGAEVGIVVALLGAATFVVIVVAVVRLAMLAADLHRLRKLRSAAPRVVDPAANALLYEVAGRLGVRRPVELLEGPLDSAPLTYGARRPVVVVPPVLLDSRDSLRTVLVHELIHVRRGDCVWALLECLTSAVFAFHPLVHRLQRGIERSRETSCDAEVMAAGIVRPSRYADLLAHTHAPTQFPLPAVAASMSARSLTLKERLETMKNFADKDLTSRQRVGIALGAGIVCLMITLAGACVNWTKEENTVRTEVSEEGKTQIREYVEGLEADRSQGPRYTMPLLNDESISYYYNATEEDVLQELARLDAQIQYLQEQIDETNATLDRLGEKAGEVVVGTEEYLTYVGELARLHERGGLLRSMRTERVRMSEIVKLEYETQKRMGDGPRPRNPPTADIF